MIHDFAGVQHGFGERGEFGVGEAPKPGRHQPGGHLIIGNFVAGVTGNEVVDFLAGVFPGIPFFSNQVNSAHAIGANARLTSAYRGVNAGAHRLEYRA